MDAGDGIRDPDCEIFEAWKRTQTRRNGTIDKSLLVKPTNNLLCRLEADRSSAGIKLPRKPFDFRHLFLATPIRIHRLVPKRSDNPRSGPLERHRGVIRRLIHPYRPLANGESPRGLLVEFHIEQIEDVPSDQQPVFLRRNCVENAVENLRRTEDVSELWAAFHPRDIKRVVSKYGISGSGEYALRQGPRSGVRDHRVSKVRNRRHHLDLILRSRRLKPGAGLLWGGNVPRRNLMKSPVSSNLPEIRGSCTDRNFSMSAGMQSPVGNPNGDKVASQP